MSMDHHRGGRLRLSRRDFLALMSASAVGFTLGGCAVNPVTGRRELMLLSEAQEVAVDQEHAPHQLSADFGVSQDNKLNAYVAALGHDLAEHSHRPGMPYSFQVVNANYINAYAFPGGTIGVTRGIMLEMGDEAALAALLGHEIGHVNARHAAQRMTRGMIAQITVIGATVAVASSEDRQGLAPLVQTLGGLSAGALLAHYSRENEREADDLGMEYADRAGQNPAGMVALHRMLLEQSQRKPNALELMFATHPMSSERVERAEQQMARRYRQQQDRPRHAERYQDSIADLRRLAPAIREQQEGEREMAREKFAQAEPHFKKALQLAPADYTGLVLMARCQYGLGKKEEAAHYADLARESYPGEAQALQVAGIARLGLGANEEAYQHFVEYDQVLPGNPNTIFLQGVSLENMGRRQDAARNYMKYLQQVGEGGQSVYARQRLTEWGVLEKR
ncbi:M48 family metalloprotease [Desulfurivibrio alkaliphilus]|uniref:Peptidase M48 Ste24p n=1 Tax=Desulfurivibrio alkaliphilus (strain DSM 19089 / UNIQEM U267 / AHT2) TaxID=589865 RepID=D6Z240_DESAT|nr:M48 family metalloprotease [Desulfurivibrio alkaliphilus]ADH85615.1 peptidase M48 Ste24p [Desulfurivibrio alkaliphilus AHT 2]